MVRLPYHPHMIGVALNGDVIPFIIHHLRTLQSEGIRSIGIEPTFKFDDTSLKILAHVAEESATNPRVREQLRTVIHSLRHTESRTIFEAIKPIAERMGFRVIDLGNPTLMRAINKSLWRRFRDHIQAGNTFSTRDGDRLRMELAHFANDAHFEYPSGYLMQPLFIKSMLQRIKKKEPEAILVSAVRAPEIIRQMKIPKSRTTWVSRGYVMHHPQSSTERRAVLHLMKQLREVERSRRIMVKERIATRARRRTQH